MPKKPIETSDQAEALNAVAYELERREWKEKHTRLNERYKEVLAQLHESDSRLGAILGLQELIDGHAPTKIKIRATGRTGESTAVLVASDWHLEERVDPRTINGVNEYNPTIAEQRLKNFFERGLSMVEMCRSRSRIDHLLLAVLGDLITGNIHEDLAETNYLTPTEATLKAYKLLCGGIDFLLAEGKFESILIPCCYGNHGRTTKKMRVATAAKNSYEWMMYHLVAERYANEPRVKFQISDGYLTFAEIYDTTIRLHHGNGIKFQGGVGGVTIPLNKAIAQWNKMRKADIDVMGHWHTRQLQKDSVINGSVIGFNAYAIEIKASFEPPCQSMFLIHPERGKTVEIPIFVN